MDSQREEVKSLNCLECDAELSVPTDAIQGEVVTCRECNAAYELVREQNGTLFTLRPAELEQEDWGE
ncbi:MAG TPA: lysine biosynthesis protein LysW [Nitrososphaerales archaeon]|nr:lysine biosynthesis protein LysW [Nitrososphaerales archaeon]